MKNIDKNTLESLRDDCMDKVQGLWSLFGIENKKDKYYAEGYNNAIGDAVENVEDFFNELIDGKESKNEPQ